PSVTVALRLARELGESVEALFGDKDEHASKQVNASWPAPEFPPSSVSPNRVALARIAGKIVAVPQPPMRLSLSRVAGTVDRVVRNRAAVSTYWSPAEKERRIGGC